MNKESDFFSRNKILVTGAHGFLGRHLVTKLKDSGCRQIFTPTQQECDLRIRENISRLLNETKPDIIIHLAARVGGIGANMKYPGGFFFDNLIMGVQLMEEARLRGVKKFVAIGTVCAYPKFTPVPFKEEDLWNGYPEETNAPYGLAKKMLLVQSQAYRKQYGFNSIFLLPVNLYGPGDSFDLEDSHVIPALIRKFYEAKRESKKEVVLWGTGNVSREFLYVQDCAEAIALATEKYNKSEPVNIGSGFEIQIKDLAKKISEIIGFRGRTVWDTSKPDGQPRRCLDVTKAKEEFGFVAETGFDEGLKKNIEWYVSNYGIVSLP